MFWVLLIIKSSLIRNNIFLYDLHNVFNERYQNLVYYLFFNILKTIMVIKADQQVNY